MWKGPGWLRVRPRNMSTPSLWVPAGGQASARDSGLINHVILNTTTLPFYASVSPPTPISQAVVEIT
jgi:hypothetical protein